jgi:hypothetical protein
MCWVASRANRDGYENVVSWTWEASTVSMLVYMVSSRPDAALLDGLPSISSYVRCHPLNPVPEQLHLSFVRGDDADSVDKLR